MTPQHIADIAVAQLGLPVPMGKLVTIQAIAQALSHAQIASVFEDALIGWVGACELESECLEALSAIVLGGARPELISRIRHAIGHPSIASDVLLSLVIGSATIVPSWSGCHSGLAPKLIDLRSEEKALRAGTFIPPIFTHTLERLEEVSNRPLVRQWAFEFSMLRRRVSSTEDGHFDYFIGTERGNGGQFIARQSHLARSAYLRTLACAVEHWGMPHRLAVDHALQALPAEPIFLKLAPGAPPPSFVPVHQVRSDTTDGQSLVREALKVVERSAGYRVMHLSAAVSDAPLSHVELIVFTVISAREIVDATQALRFHDYMLGKITPTRDGLRAFICPDMGHEGTEGLGFVPTVVPLIGPTVGYLQSDFVGRIPYVPLSSSSMPKVEISPRVGGGPITSLGEIVGEFASWYWNWQPAHPHEWPSPTACCSILTREAAGRLEADHRGALQHVWKVVTWSRATEYAEWTFTEEVGVTPSMA